MYGGLRLEESIVLGIGNYAMRHEIVPSLSVSLGLRCFQSPSSAIMRSQHPTLDCVTSQKSVARHAHNRSSKTIHSIYTQKSYVPVRHAARANSENTLTKCLIIHFQSNSEVTLVLKCSAFLRPSRGCCFKYMSVCSMRVFCMYRQSIGPEKL